jgi:hypothetical protein
MTKRRFSDFLHWLWVPLVCAIGGWALLLTAPLPMRTLRNALFDPVRGKPCRLGQGQERGRQSGPCVGFSAESVVAQCTDE